MFFVKLLGVTPFISLNTEINADNRLYGAQISCNLLKICLTKLKVLRLIVTVNTLNY